MTPRPRLAECKRSRDPADARTRPPSPGGLAHPPFSVAIDGNPDARTLRIAAGTYAVGGRAVVIPRTLTARVAPPARVRVEGEPARLWREAPKWTGRTLLAASVSPVEAHIRRPESLVAGSAAVRRADGGALLREGVDYALDAYWSALSLAEGAALPPGAPVRVDYESWLQRVDLLQWEADGTVRVKMGAPAAVGARPPAPDAGATALAYVYVPARDEPLSAAHVHPLPASALGWRSFLFAEGADRLSGLRGKMAAGRAATLVAWGDSVTAGATASSPENTFVRRTETALRGRFGNPGIRFVNAGVDGTSTVGRVAAFDAEVLAHRPDAIVMEFVNDVKAEPAAREAAWRRAFASARAANPDVALVVLTPTLVAPSWMENYDATVSWMRRFARDNGAALADASRTWTCLAGIGIPYETLLTNAINHPDDTGHAIFSETLLKLMDRSA